jgi:hypothetical protein
MFFWQISSPSGGAAVYRQAIKLWDGKEKVNMAAGPGSCGGGWTSVASADRRSGAILLRKQPDAALI